MKWYLLGMMAIPLVIMGACSPSINPMATPTVAANTPTHVPATFTLVPTDISTATYTPPPILTSTATPTSTPLPPTPTAVPPPYIQFNADRSYIKIGMCVVFTWDVKNSRAVYFYAEGEPWEDKMVESSASSEECRKESTMYYLRVVGFDGTVEIRKIHIPVESLPGL